MREKERKKEKSFFRSRVEEDAFARISNAEDDEEREEALSRNRLGVESSVSQSSRSGS